MGGRRRRDVWVGETHKTEVRKRRNFTELDRLNLVTEVSMFSAWLQTNITAMLFQINFVGEKQLLEVDSQWDSSRYN